MNRRIAVIGLGYVGLPLAADFGKQTHVVGIDVSAQRIEDLRKGADKTGEVDEAALAAADIEFTTDFAALKNTDFIIVTVPTPITSARRPDLGPLDRASRAVAAYLKSGDIVVYESTVYPGVTEEFCAPILEEGSGLKCGTDFFVGYSPERINPGDKTRSLEKIVKVVSGQTAEVLDIVADVYGSIIEAGVHKAANIKTAEAAKVIENTQRDLNIALVNELAMIFDRIGIDTLDVLEAAGTKWNFLPFRPGLVGGHCIGVDPYYLTHKAEELGYHPHVILAGRRINDGMSEYVARKTLKLLIRAGIDPNGARIGLLGLTFKENVPDLRNSKVADLCAELREYNIEVSVHDPLAEPAEAKREYGIDLADESALAGLDGVVFAVGHQTFLDKGADWIQKMLKPGGVVVDVKGSLPGESFDEGGFLYWRL